ncbi:hypothetical protein GCM10011387_28640 [Pedobacter quisquiliarum]|uniref:Uncharacterized protein n=1 Tax=Pedobacter quisquiliarum TaxID=1834438 RepID=A0A916UJP0_9SPHI|nr:hypothetical protein GCM10011387_28640 [Pedobacter quisquiliarum]
MVHQEQEQALVDLAVAQLALVLVALEQPEQVQAPDQVLAVEPLLVEQPADLEQQPLQLNNPLQLYIKKPAQLRRLFYVITFRMI